MQIGSYVFLILCLVIAWLFGSFGDLTVLNWRYVDVSLVFFGGLGFFSAVSEASRIHPRHTVERKKNYALGWLQATRYSASVLPQVVCMKFKPSPLVPDEKRIADQKQHDLACPWAKEVAEIFSGLREGEVPELEELKLPEINKEVTDEFILKLKEEFQSSVERYLFLREQYIVARDKLKASSFDIALSVFSPFLISIAIGLSFLKALYQ